MDLHFCEDTDSELGTVRELKAAEESRDTAASLYDLKITVRQEDAKEASSSEAKVEEPEAKVEEPQEKAEPVSSPYLRRRRPSVDKERSKRLGGLVNVMVKASKHEKMTKGLNDTLTIVRLKLDTARQRLAELGGDEESDEREALLTEVEEDQKKEAELVAELEGVRRKYSLTDEERRTLKRQVMCKQDRNAEEARNRMQEVRAKEAVKFAVRKEMEHNTEVSAKQKMKLIEQHEKERQDDITALRMQLSELKIRIGDYESKSTILEGDPDAQYELREVRASVIACNYEAEQVRQKLEEVDAKWKELVPVLTPEEERAWRGLQARQQERAKKLEQDAEAKRFHSAKEDAKKMKSSSSAKKRRATLDGTRTGLKTKLEFRKQIDSHFEHTRNTLKNRRDEMNDALDALKAASEVAMAEEKASIVEDSIQLWNEINSIEEELEELSKKHAEDSQLAQLNAAERAEQRAQRALTHKTSTSSAVAPEEKEAPLSPTTPHSPMLGKDGFDPESFLVKLRGLRRRSSEDVSQPLPLPEDIKRRSSAQLSAAKFVGKLRAALLNKEKPEEPLKEPLMDATLVYPVGSFNTALLQRTRIRSRAISSLHESTICVLVVCSAAVHHGIKVERPRLTVDTTSAVFERDETASVTSELQPSVDSDREAEKAETIPIELEIPRFAKMTSMRWCSKTSASGVCAALCLVSIVTSTEVECELLTTEFCSPVLSSSTVSLVVPLTYPTLPGQDALQSFINASIDPPPDLVATPPSPVDTFFHARPEKQPIPKWLSKGKRSQIEMFEGTAPPFWKKTWRLTYGVAQNRKMRKPSGLVKKLREMREVDELKSTLRSRKKKKPRPEIPNKMERDKNAPVETVVDLPHGNRLRLRITPQKPCHRWEPATSLCLSWVANEVEVLPVVTSLRLDAHMLSTTPPLEHNYLALPHDPSLVHRIMEVAKLSSTVLQGDWPTCSPPHSDSTKPVKKKAPTKGSRPPAAAIYAVKFHRY